MAETRADRKRLPSGGAPLRPGSTPPPGQKKVLAVSSGGGHWMQLMRLNEALAGHKVIYASVSKHYHRDVAPQKLFAVTNATRWNKFALVALALQIFWITVKVRPDIVISTGAAPGYFALRFGKLLGARTIWVDSIANAEEVSLSGRLAEKHADLWLTQWPHLEKPGGPVYRGSLL
jgi:UDP-N-acetylglucosamine:LPS N-acetylglucosamine transferase